MLPIPQGPKHLSLGSLEQEILAILWQKSAATAREVHQQILSDPDRELTIASVMTVLKRLVQKGWVKRRRCNRIFHWQATVSQAEAQALRAHDQLQKFLDISNPDLVAMFADRLDPDSVDKLEQIAQRLKQLRSQEVTETADPTDTKHLGGSGSCI